MVFQLKKGTQKHNNQLNSTTNVLTVGGAAVGEFNQPIGEASYLDDQRAEVVKDAAERLLNLS